MAIPQDFIIQLRERCNIADLIGSYVPLKRAGRYYKGLCPFHSEKTPSFTVFPDTASYYCFGCQAGGDAISFIRAVERLDYVEAIKFLAAKEGLTVPEDGVNDGLGEAKRRMKEANREAARFFHAQLFSPAGKEALAYLRSRGLRDDTIRHFGLGWSPDSWDALSKHLKAKGFKDEELCSANLSMTNRFGGLTDRFRNRVMFPIIDLQGSVIAFGGRTMEKEHQGKKYLNTSDTLVYKKTNNLYAMNFAKNSAGDTLIVTEGFMDVIALWQEGFDNVVASQGTAFTAEQARLISRYAKKVVLSQDGDAAGQNAIRRSIPVLKSTGVEVRVLVIPENLDPDEYIKKYGAESLRSLLGEAANDIEYTLIRTRSQFDISTDDGRMRYLKEACAVLAGLSPIEQDIYISRLSRELEVDQAAIRSEIARENRFRHRTEKREELKQMEANLSGRADKQNPQRQERPKAAKAEERIISMLFASPDILPKLREKLPPEKMVTEFNRRLYQLAIKLCDEGIEPSMSLLAQDLTPEEMGALSRILNAEPTQRQDPGELDALCAIVLQEGERPSGDMTEISKEDINDYIKSLAKRKKQ